MSAHVPGRCTCALCGGESLAVAAITDQDGVIGTEELDRPQEAVSISMPRTGDINIDSLLSSSRWTSGISYGFPVSASQ